LSNPVPKRPVLLFDFNQVDHDVLHADLKFVTKTLCQSLIEGLLVLDCPTFAERDLDEKDAVCALDSEIVNAID
jgi:hypothetical protein